MEHRLVESVDDHQDDVGADITRLAKFNERADEAGNKCVRRVNEALPHCECRLNMWTRQQKVTVCGELRGLTEVVRDDARRQ